MWLLFILRFSLNIIVLKIGAFCSKMGNQHTKPEEDADTLGQLPKSKNNNLNIHEAIKDIKIHSTVSFSLDYNHEAAMKIPLGEVY